MKNEYWHCIIGPTDREQLPDGSDFPMRMAVGHRFAQLTGEYAKHNWSGWGVDDELKDLILKVQSIKTLNLAKYEKLKSEIMSIELI